MNASGGSAAYPRSSSLPNTAMRRSAPSYPPSSETEIGKVIPSSVSCSASVRKRE